MISIIKNKTINNHTPNLVEDHHGTKQDLNFLLDIISIDTIHNNHNTILYMSHLNHSRYHFTHELNIINMVFTTHFPTLYVAQNEPKHLENITFNKNSIVKSHEPIQEETFEYNYIDLNGLTSTLNQNAKTQNSDIFYMN
ncbi:hypothetical protein ACJX0J_039301 [Zea mays]